MKKREIVRKQLDDKLLAFQNADSIVPPASGWVYALRFALNMSLRQLGQRLSITPQSVKEIEEREKNGTIFSQGTEAGCLCTEYGVFLRFYSEG